MGGRDLSGAEAEGALRALLAWDLEVDGDVAARTAFVAALLASLRTKGETAEEVAGLARAMQAEMVRVDRVAEGTPVLDIVGTGGDGAGTVNISTGACLVAAAAGARVAKHGSRSVSSLCGSADVVEALGVAVELGPSGVAETISKCGMGFMFAPRFHPAMGTVKAARQALKVRTVFNILGPMLNPAGCKHSLVGVFSKEVMPLMAGALRDLGQERALVVHSAGLDELTPCAPADVLEIRRGEELRSYTVDPRDLGVPPCTLEDLKGGDRDTNAQMLRDVFGGQKGPVADALNLNAAFALAANGLAKSPAEGLAMAREAQESGGAGRVLEAWSKESHAQKALET